MFRYKYFRDDRKQLLNVYFPSVAKRSTKVHIDIAYEIENTHIFL